MQVEKIRFTLILDLHFITLLDILINLLSGDIGLRPRFAKGTTLYYPNK